MRLGGMILKPWNSPQEWAALAVEAGYGAVYFPVDYRADQKTIDAYARAAGERGLVIAETGAWSNLLDPDEKRSREALEKTIGQLELADYVSARCCVNISGSCSAAVWDGPHPDNLTPRTFERIVRITQRVLDAVRPQNTWFALEPMPWAYPDSADSYLRLLEAVDRPRFGVHLDPVNVVSSPRLYYENGAMLNEWFDKLGPHIRSCHGKDITLGDELTVHLSECRPGLGNLDYRTFLTRLAALPDDVPLMLEHMTQEEDYHEGVRYLKETATSLGLSFLGGNEAAEP